MSDLNQTRLSKSEVSLAIRETVNYLIENDVNAGLIAAALAHHATSLSYAACDDPTIIFKTLLSSILRSIPVPEEEFDDRIASRVTHQVDDPMIN